ncbi:MAG: DUF2834 domain-containing protein, partial [Anaerolineae bacterium]|nr:DUF2834 domain-containing protein [Gemmatimonadaceae bacterium]
MRETTKYVRMTPVEEMLPVEDPNSRTMQRVYLGFAILGFLVPNVFTVMESVETGNILFWTNPALTMSELFINRTSTAFALDLILVAIVALVWMTYEARRVGIARVWRFWILALLFG